MTRKIEIYDTTLRDGAQMRGISFSVNDKLKILRILDELGISYVEGGWPGANPKDVDFFTEAAKLKLETTKLTAFGSTKKARSKTNEDLILNALLRSECEDLCIVAKSSALQVTSTLRVELEHNLDMLSDSISYLKSKSRKVMIDAEHFFDGYLDNPEYTDKFVARAIESGAENIIFCDTNGGSLPEQVYNVTKRYCELYPEQKFGIHAHNDAELAVANSVRAGRAGAIQVQGTINGYGERCGNANLISIIPNLELKYKKDKIQCLPKGKLSKLTETACSIAEIANLNMNSQQAFVGYSAFAHKAGLHVSAMQRSDFSYEHIVPAKVGNKTKVIISEQSGVSNIIEWLAKNKIEVEASEPTDDYSNTEIPAESDNNSLKKSFAAKLLAKIKEREHKGYTYENAEASLALLASNVANEENFKLSNNAFPKYFDFIENNVHILNGEKTEATVRIRVGNQLRHSVSYGDGPANALDNALRKALRDLYPEVDNFSLQDYKVRIIDSHLGTAAKTKVQINTGNIHSSWDTLGVSNNIIKASWEAIVDSIIYGLANEDLESKNY